MVASLLALRLMSRLACRSGVKLLRTHAERIGTELEGQQRAAMDYVDAAHEPPADEYAAPGVLVVETDGVMVR